MASIGGIYLNFGLWAIALLPGWLVVRQIGVTLGDKKLEREGLASRERERIAEAQSQEKILLCVNRSYKDIDRTCALI